MAKQIRVARSGNVLKAAKTEDLQSIKKLPEGELVKITVQRVRNPRLHRRYFAVIQTIYENQSFFTDREHLRKFLEIAAGHYTVAYMPKPSTGEIKELIWPKSIAYGALDQDSFSELYDEVLVQAEKQFGLEAKLLHQENFYE